MAATGCHRRSCPVPVGEGRRAHLSVRSSTARQRVSAVTACPCPSQQGCHTRARQLVLAGSGESAKTVPCLSSRCFLVRKCISFTYSPLASHTAVSLLGLGASETACEPFKRGISVPHSASGPSDASPVGFLNHTLSELVSSG